MKIRSASVAAIVLALSLLPLSGASAHEEREVDGHTIVVGWLDEPAYAGFKNAVQFIVSHGDEPVENAELQVEVTYGDSTDGKTTDPMPLEAAWDAPGEYHAYLIPTEPGTYTFRVFGTLEEGEEFDESFTSGEDTFSNIEDPADIEFPTVVSGAPDAPEAMDDASSEGSNTMAYVGIGLGALAIVLALVALSRKRSA